MNAYTSQSIAYVLNDEPYMARSVSGSPRMSSGCDGVGILPSMASLSLSSSVVSPATPTFPPSFSGPYEPNSAMTFAADVAAEAQKRRMMSMSGMFSSPSQSASPSGSAPGSPVFHPHATLGMTRARSSSASSTGTSTVNATSQMSSPGEATGPADTACGIHSGSHSGTSTPLYNAVDVEQLAVAAVAAAANVAANAIAMKPRKKAPAKKASRARKEKTPSDSQVFAQAKSAAGIRRNRRGRPSLQTPLECPHCKRGGFMQVSKLNKHMKTHSRPHACYGCDMTFATPRDMQRHARRHEDIIEVWKCSCSVTFTRDYNMRRHQRHNDSCSALGCYRTSNHGGRRAPITKKTTSA